MAKRSAPSTVKRSAPFTDQTSEGFETRWADFIEALSPRERALLEAAGLLGSGTATDASRRQRADLMALFDAGKGINPITLQQVRAMNAGARGELREKLRWINKRISEGYTREEARHLYYEWGGEGQELNPNKTLSDEEIDRLYDDYLAGNTPNALEEEGSLEADPDLMGTSTVEETIGDEDFTTDPLPTPTPTDGKAEVDDIGGTELTEVDATAESTYTLPENEPVDAKSLTPEQLTTAWPQIKEALGKVSSTVGKLIFGPKGMPTSVDEWIEWVDETIQAQFKDPGLPFPIVITYDPNIGTWLDLKIPVNFDVNGNPIRIPLFDEDGNFVGSEELGEAWTDAKGQIFGPLGEIGEILTDGEGNILVDLKKIGNVLLDDLSMNEDGTLTGSSTATVAIGKLFLNPDTGEWEEEGEGEVGEQTPETSTAVVEDSDEPPPQDVPIVGDDAEEEDTTPTKKTRTQGRVITDKEGNVVEINRPDAITGDGGVRVLEGTTTVDEPFDNQLDDDVWDNGGRKGTTLDPSSEGEELFEDPVATTQDPVDTNGEPDTPFDINNVDGGPSDPVLPDDSVIVGGPVITEGDPEDPVVGGPVIVEEDPVVGGPVIVEEGPEDPLVGTGDPIVEDPLVGTSSDGGGGGGGGGGGLGSGGYMGGLSYGLPPFVGVQYQPKDYTSQLNRIINESLFKGMI